MTTRARLPLALPAISLVLLSSAPAAAQWIEKAGHGWVQLTVYHHDTDEQFGTEGETRPFFAEGHAVTTSLFVTAAAGVVRGMDVWVQLPAHSLVFTDLAGRRERIGAGDPRVFVRVGPELLGWRARPLALRAGVKFPAGDFPVDAEVIPLTEGQRDYEAMLELGHSFWPKPAWAMGWLGYRWRGTNQKIDRKPGNELFGFASVGGRVGRLSLKLSGEVLVGRTPRLLGLEVPRARREIYQIFPSLGWRLGRGDVELGARIPLAGQNLPAGPAVTVGYFLPWSKRADARRRSFPPFASRWGSRPRNRAEARSTKRAKHQSGDPAERGAGMRP